jgi:uncharacterized protein YjbJ (UPF0337 family)
MEGAERSASGMRGNDATEQGGFGMGFADKAKDKAEELAGKAKAAMGDATDNPDLETEGRMQEAKADVKQAGEDASDTRDSVADALRSASEATKFGDKDTSR